MTAMRCEYISWHRFQRLCTGLCQRVQAAPFEPDAIIGIARGGYLPARMLADLFGVVNLAALKIEHYRGTRKSRRARITHSLPEGFRGRRVLLVDDVSDSGDTFAAALDHIAGRAGIGEVRTAVLHHKLTSAYVPDYFARRVLAWRWIIYPWALAEDLPALVDGLAERPASVDELAQSLRDTYALRIPGTVLAAVVECLETGR